ncbi:glycoside hydrolase [Exidia glandulosa HHB12029]|uniref:non-reducing end alpha-L-arabinofuranosidase n=1 Tax=Exidia glandulosa HHB12029 TaxID=1314781 RepID=A0A165R2W9_EXIGL|nr:glycoside hydrolase [Exidia glandulosa HHB12029]
MLNRLVGAALLSAVVTVAVRPVVLDIDASKGNATEFTVAAFVETNIGRADDGGLYAELIQNRAFQEADSYLSIPGWTKVGDRTVLMKDADEPLAALQNSMQIWVPGNETEGLRAGLSNSGWWGIPVKPQTYKASFFAKRAPDSPLEGTIQLTLSSTTNGRTYASASLSAQDVTVEWKQFHATLTPTESAPDANNVFNLTIDVTKHDQGLWVNLVSLFPPTLNDRPNGLRKDLANVVKDMGAKYIRIPGGSNLQGSTIANGYNWTATLGALESRPGRLGYWVGYQTEGLGLKELLDMCEDFNASAILGVYAAYSASDQSVPNTPQLDKYIESAVNELHFVLGDPATNKWAKLRADLGHPEPYHLEYVELGNEDYTSTTYDYRWERFTSAMSAAYPHLKYVASADLTGAPVVDLHDFSGPDAFISSFDRYDNRPRTGTKVLELENAVITTNSADPFGDPVSRLLYPTLQGSLAEAVFIMGMQRNGDLVLGTSYAPYLANVHATQWTPNMINFNATHILRSTSYYVHQMISKARADTVHPTTSTTSFGPLYWVATSANSRTFFLQVANVNSTAIPLSATIHNIRVNFRSPSPKASATVLTSPLGLNASNTMDELDVVRPAPLAVQVLGNARGVSLSAVIPGYSFSVIRVDV